MEENTTLSTPPGGHGTYESIVTFIDKTDKALTNAQTDDILPPLKKRGYTQSDLVAKLSENAALKTLNETQKKEYGEQFDATGAYKKAHDALNITYLDDLKLARFVFKKSEGAQKALGLNGSRSRSQGGYAAQGLLFYDNALADTGYMAALAKKGIDEDVLKAGQAAFANLKSLAAAQDRETGEAIGSTGKRDAAYDALHEWMMEFEGTAKVALREKPELLKALGL